jgi:hypothetical protein
MTENNPFNKTTNDWYEFALNKKSDEDRKMVFEIWEMIMLSC